MGHARHLSPSAQKALRRRCSRASLKAVDIWGEVQAGGREALVMRPRGRWGLSFQRPDKRAVEQDPEAVCRQHEEVWPTIRAKAGKSGGEVAIRSD
ncbi:hypothetical protein [Streptomyces vietnamensis]|uniref:Uncharacterized protein n=1 Tax=Streptomyces vietnamensis TaxID=362257 RepID=A0A0B5HY28_9ACTN|nr:hypothetical protein SVTN_00325 [Streptomyces vietnamensis]